MNLPDPPLSGETLDELLSADIDGEMGRAATELGFTLAEARAAIDAAPGAEARRVALTRARDVLASQPALDGPRASRLVATVLARADAGRNAAQRPPIDLRARRPQIGWRALAGVGTAAAVIAGIIALAATNPGSESKASSSRAAAPASAPLSKPSANKTVRRSPVRFGDVSQKQSLQTKALAALAHSDDSVLAQPAATGALNGTNAAKTATGAKGSGVVTSVKGNLQVCIASVVNEEHLRSAPVLSGTGTDTARPVFVVVFRTATATTVYVLSANDCSLVTRVTLP